MKKPLNKRNLNRSLFESPKSREYKRAQLSSTDNSSIFPKDAKSVEKRYKVILKETEDEKVKLEE